MHQISDKELANVLQDMVQLLEMEQERHQVDESSNESPLINIDDNPLVPAAIVKDQNHRIRQHRPGIIKDASQKRNAELINSLLGLPRIMKVVG